jgi:hypothetical protein
LSWLVKKLVSRLMASTRAGDIRPTLALDAPDLTFVFPGRRSVMWAKLSWGRLKAYEVYEDTEKVQALHDYLATHEPALMPSQAE